MQYMTWLVAHHYHHKGKQYMDLVSLTNTECDISNPWYCRALPQLPC